MMFGPALSLGVATLDEYVDLKLSCEPDVALLPAMLQPGAPDGLSFTAAVRLGPNDPAISKVVNATEYVAALPWSWVRANGYADVDAVRAHVDAQRAGSMVVFRKIEGLGKKIDVATYLEAVEPGDGGDAIERAGYMGDLLPLRFRTRALATGAAKASEVIEALFGSECPARYIRTAMGLLHEGRVVSPLALDELRAARAAMKEREVAAAPAVNDEVAPASA